MAATKSSKDARQVGLSWHKKRCEVRESQRRESILDLDSSVLIIMKFCYCWSLFCRGQSKGTQTNCTVAGLRAVQEHLMHGYAYGYLHLEEAYNLYSSFSEFSCPNKQAFKDKMLDPHHGLPVYKESSTRLFGLLRKENCFLGFNYDMF